MTTKKVLVLTFRTASNREISLAIKAPKENLSSEAISKAMDEIIASQAFGSQSLVVSKASAKYIIGQVDDILINEST